MDQDEEARRARAKRLRDQIRELVGPGKVERSTAADRPERPKAEQAKPSEPRDQELPREFIHRRMRELAGTDKNG